MLGDLSHVEKIYIRTGYTDMRKQLNGLVDIIQYDFQLDPYSNTVFLFCGRRADRIKAVHYEGLSEDSCYPHILLRNRIDFSRYSYSFP